MDGLYLIGTGVGTSPVLSPKALEKDSTLARDVELYALGKDLRFSVRHGFLDCRFCRDFTPFETLKISVYSECADGAKVNILLNNMGTTRRLTPRPPYFTFSFVRDFVGEKTVSLDLNHYVRNRGTYFPTTLYIDTMEIELCPSEKYPDAQPLIFDTPILEGPIYRLSGAEPTAEDFEKLRERIVSIYCGNPTPSDLLLPEYRERIALIEKECADTYKAFLDTYNGKKDSAWGISLALERWQESRVSAIYGNIFKLAKGYGTKGCRFYKDAELLKTILTALEYGYDYYYGENVRTEGTFGNWWQWEIGTPLNLSPTLMIIAPDVNIKLINKYLYPMDYLVPKATMTACNKIWLARTVINSAILRRDAIKLIETRDSMLDMFPYVKSGDGMYTDGSFIQHGGHSYAGGYGIGFISMVTELLYTLEGTKFKYTDPVINNHYKWVFENYVPITYKGRLFSATCGREVSRPTYEEGKMKNLVASLVKMSEYAPKDMRARLRGFIGYSMTEGGLDIINTLSLPFISTALEIKSAFCERGAYLQTRDVCDKIGAECNAPDSDIIEYKIPDGTRVFGKMDRVVRKGEKYGACVAMSSNRITKFEPMNLENMDGWYQGEGVLYVYSGKNSGKGGYDYGYDFYGFTNPYRLPGITVSSVKRPYAENYSPGVALTGGVEGGRFGSAMFSLRYDPVRRAYATDIKANKSYFLFDEEIVCLGSGISDTSGTETLTVVDSRYLESIARKYGIRKIKSQELINNGQVMGDRERPADSFIGCKQLFTVNENKFDLNFENSAINRQTVANFDKFGGFIANLEGVGGYIIPAIDGKEQSIEVRLRDNVNVFFELTLSHGKYPEDERYAYYVLPDATEKESADYAEALKKNDSSVASVVVHTTNMHAVKKQVDGVYYLGVNCFDIGTVKARDINPMADGEIALSMPRAGASFLVAQRDGDTVRLTVNISDPTQQLKYTTLSLTPSLLFPDIIPADAPLVKIEQSERSRQDPKLPVESILPGFGKVDVKLPLYGADITEAVLCTKREEADRDLCGYDFTVAITPTPYCNGEDKLEGSAFVTADQRLQVIADLNFNIGDTKSVTLVYKL